MAEHCATDELADAVDSPRAGQVPTRVEAARYCRRLAAGHYENFSVLSRLLPRHVVSHFSAVYAWCRWADDLADESPDTSANLRALDAWQRQTEDCYASAAPVHPVFVALRETIDEFSIPADPFLQLLDAFRQDQVKTRYASHDEVLDYCRRSANPVGRLVLYMGRCHDELRGRVADSISTGLQLANFCQDVARDFAIGRIYLPHSTLERFGYHETMFARGQCNQAFRGVLACEVERARGYLLAGRPLVDSIASELRLPLVLFVEGGLRILDQIRRIDYDVWRRRPTLSRLAKATLVWRAWRRARRGGSKEGL